MKIKLQSKPNWNSAEIAYVLKAAELLKREATFPKINISRFCNEIGISRKNAYKHKNKFEQLLEGLQTENIYPYGLIRKKSKFDPYSDYVLKRMRNSCVKSKQLYSELCLKGYSGILSSLQHRMRLLRKQFDIPQIKKCTELTTPIESFSSYQIVKSYNWMLRLLQGKIKNRKLEFFFKTKLGKKEIHKLRDFIINKPLRYRNRAIIILAYLKGIPPSTIAQFLMLNISVINNGIKSFENDGIDKIFDFSKKDVKKYEEKKYIDIIFSILHSPPISHGINRATWRQQDIHLMMLNRGLPISINGIRKIIKNAGYKYKRARKVLTSNDPEYREKLKVITQILSNLKPDERFFSVDEFGPLAIKLRGGRTLIAPNEVLAIPQYQKSKRSLIVTASLELSTNQITHFYSEKKNTTEMIKLLNVILEEYKQYKYIYFSWDAASWHASKNFLKEWMKSIVIKTYQMSN